MTDLERALANRGRLVELADELEALDRVSKKSRSPEELKACAVRASEIATQVRKIQGRAVRESGRLIKELQAAPGFDLFSLPEWRTALGDLIASRPMIEAAHARRVRLSDFPDAHASQQEEPHG